MIIPIGSKVKIIDREVLEKFHIDSKCVGRVTRFFDERVTVEFIQNNQRTKLNLFINQIKLI